MPSIIIDNIEIPHSDTELFKRVRNWMQDGENISGVAHPLLSSKDLEAAAREMIADLKRKRLLLLFASAVPVDRVTRHSGYYVNGSGRGVIELFVPEHIKLADDVTKSESEKALRQIGETSLAALAVDALMLYADNVYAANHRRPVTFAPLGMGGKPVVEPEPI
ncbi:MAG: hypothetical protein KGI37_03885 [Alphaproteobacteria bacterium]|nr:hypothetical protein [Alphaproteobacteria bacterium]